LYLLVVKYPFQSVFQLFATPPTFPVEKQELNIKIKKSEESNTIAFKNNIFSHSQLSLLK